MTTPSKPRSLAEAVAKLEGNGVALLLGPLNLTEALAALKADHRAFPWTERRSLAEAAANVIGTPEDRGVAFQIAQLLSNDERPEVRKVIATLLPSLSDEEIAKIGGGLTEDANYSVKRAAELALESRKMGFRGARPYRKGLDRIIDRFEVLNTAVRDKARGMAIQLYEVSVAATVHDLRGILTSSFAQIERMQTDQNDAASDRSAIADGLNRLHGDLKYIEKFVEAMSTYTNFIPTHRAPVRLKTIVEESHRFSLEAVCIRHPTCEDVRATITVDETITVTVAQHQIVAAITNVLKNAYEAVLFEADDGHVGEVKLNADAQGDGNVKIVIQDNGIGITVDDLRELRAFVPGRTTKKGYGTGFGLPIVQRYVAAHGGSISIDSSENVGTTVTIILPMELQQVPEE